MKYTNQLPSNLLTLKAGFFLTFLILTSTQLSAQVQKDLPPPLPSREVSGIVKDSTDVGLPGASVTLTSDKDTLKTSTNADGIFVFKDVKSAVYTISIKSIGYLPSPPMRYKQNDAVPRIVMDPIILKEENNTLNEVVINGTPSITYKTDTVEYKASDYVVRENATVDELLKKMEGMEVGKDGSLTHQGEKVTKAKINGKDYLNGDIATAIQNLPAEIVDKIQIVDDYGDEAARTGVKDGDPQKILNITTRTDKSVGSMFMLGAGAGTKKIYEASVFGTRINANQVVGLNSKFSNTINGNGGGTTETINPAFSYRDKLGEKIELNMNYGYNYTNSNSTNESTSATNSLLGILYSHNLSNSEDKSKTHNFKFQMDIDLDSNNFLRISPSIDYSSTLNNSNSSIFQTGRVHQDQISDNSRTNTRPNLGLVAFYQHIFKKPGRNISFQASLSHANQQADQQQFTELRYYDTLTNVMVKDSLVNRLLARKNLQQTYRGSMTYVEPLTANTQFEVNSQVTYNGYNNNAITSNLDAGGGTQIVDSLSNIYDYSFTQARIAMNYRYGIDRASKVRFSLGLTGVPAVLSGTKVSLGTTTHRTSFNLIPIARFQYAWSRQESMQFDYTGTAVEPTFDQIQPVRDVSDPQNPVVGNPNLLATFNHSIKAGYNNYIANSKLNLSADANATFTKNAVIRNVIEIRDVYDTYKHETNYINANGVYVLNGNYTISKQLNDRKYNLSLTGSVNYNHSLSMSDGVMNINNRLTTVEKFGPRINPNDWFEINPSISYNVTKSNNTLPNYRNSKTNTTALNVDGRIYFLKDYLFGYDASKNYVKGISSNVTSNPFVINAYIEKEFFRRRGKITLQAFDLLNQNNFVNRQITDDGGYIDTKSNSSSRYFMLRFTMRLQKWSGAKPRRGHDKILRRGDGSFM